jgi:hypothetical protein
LERGDESIFVGELCKSAANTWEKERLRGFSYDAEEAEGYGFAEVAAVSIKLLCRYNIYHSN